MRALELMTDARQSLRTLTVLHFNDVYQLEVGGDAERFAHAVRPH